jgi:predicted dehydrogenase
VSEPLRVAIAGCGLIGHKRARALRPDDLLVGAYDLDEGALERFATEHGGEACRDLPALLGLEPDVVVVATTHDSLAPLSLAVLAAGHHVLVEKPAGLGTAEIEQLQAAALRAGRRVKVGFNHRFHPGIARAAAEVHSGEHGPLLHLRGRYGHGGRPGYDREWRADPARSGGGELIDQGMHLLDLSHWIAGPLPLHSSLLRTSFWDMAVEDNAALLLGQSEGRDGVWAMLHVTWTEWKNLFSLEIYCRIAKIQVDGLGRSYGPETLRIYRMGPELGPPELEEVVYEDTDGSWSAEWEHFVQRLDDGGQICGDLADAHYAWSCIEAAYALSETYGPVRTAALGGGVR